MGLLLGLPGDILALVAIVLMPAELCDAGTCEALRAMCGSCRALRAFFAETRAAFTGTYVHVDSPMVCAFAHRAGLSFDPVQLSARVARDFSLFARMSSLIASSGVSHTHRAALIDLTSVEMYTSLLLRCAALDASAYWTRRVTEVRIHGSWLGTCSEIAAFANLRTLALVECRCHTVAGLDELAIDSLAIDGLAFYANSNDGRYVGPVIDVGHGLLAPILRIRKLVVRNTPALAAWFSGL
jgi:hypothetical protein